ncbi:5-oxoprolinase subunit PxpB [Pseudomonas matsuisoli]|uniref:Allophanate hydrolase n=1 Tax=Pseudomonas matsuisoli TaxID=1515666 RepID=A0A917V0V8_9PSED|nr:5-oxoprolinase subunit PxpB [Pseudomonas matsuisoli]GGK05473.1 allophanate hydrolase [Pseudomonas matsuisoli]
MGQPLAIESLVNVPSPDAWRIVPSGDTCLIIQVAETFSLDANRRAAAIARQIEARRAQGVLVGITDVVPGMISVGVHYWPDAVPSTSGELPYRSLTRQLDEVLRTSSSDTAIGAAREIDIPVCYGGEFGPDLDEVAQACGLTPNEVIAGHTASPVDVLMLGFAPGHAYIGEFASSLTIPRRSTPRTRVAKGSIGLANRQSVIYPTDLPGGWNLIGRTPLSVFDLADTSPCLLQAGDRVRFVEITPDEFQALTGQPT